MACGLLDSGASMEEIDQLMRHAQQCITAIFAKVDQARLAEQRQVSQKFQSCQHLMACVTWLLLYSHPAGHQVRDAEKKGRTVIETSLSEQQGTTDLLNVDVQELEQRQETSVWGAINNWYNSWSNYNGPITG